ncbi:uncharacterized protein LOC128743725 [Sabethes cyaneus]|uniref:uncharacterized protein LOC128743725 n=1 Tax=Sabethes cyaneus TaxID=53552 RepID=UPI00237D4297|nr:uncharacterized protein LOC128743725 [Sabethes cyaneus]
MEDRKELLNNVECFVAKSNQLLSIMLQDFKWIRGDLMKPPNTVVLRRKQNEAINEPLPESFYSDQHRCSIKIATPDTESDSSRFTPSSHADLVINLSREERLLYYQDVILQTPTLRAPPEIQINFKKKDADAKMTSLEDIVSYRRDIRRRNQKYRIAKNPLTYQEELRKLIQLQAEALTEYISGQSSSESKRAMPHAIRDDYHRSKDNHGSNSKDLSSKEKIAIDKYKPHHKREHWINS